MHFKHVFNLFLLALLILLPGCDPRKSARAELEHRKIPFSEESFVKSVRTGDAEVAELFIKAGIDPNLEVDLRKAGFGVPDSIYTIVQRIPILLVAQASEHTEIADMLVKNGADLARADKARVSLDTAEQKFVDKVTKDREKVFPEFLR